jgi:hypothetical protein
MNDRRVFRSGELGPDEVALKTPFDGADMVHVVRAAFVIYHIFWRISFQHSQIPRANPPPHTFLAATPSTWFLSLAKIFFFSLTTSILRPVISSDILRFLHGCKPLPRCDLWLALHLALTPHLRASDEPFIQLPWMP